MKKKDVRKWNLKERIYIIVYVFLAHGFFDLSNFIEKISIKTGRISVLFYEKIDNLRASKIEKILSISRRNK